ncbi:hypothetical protein OH77DRAFT_513233 [Trametes cingulata]|nr:hypothetical protein OH77DRAFT_513233 [Trametes cingulata]
MDFFHVSNHTATMASSTSDSPPSILAPPISTKDFSAARVHLHGLPSPDIYHHGTPATPTPSASLSGIYGHFAGRSAEGTVMGRSATAGAQTSSRNGDTASEFYESRSSNIPSRPFHDISDDYATQGQHVLCVARASEERLLSTGNVAYTLAKDRIKVLTKELHTLHIETDMQRKLYEDLVSKIPQLLGMIPNVEHESLEVTSGSSTQPIHGRVVLGLGWVYPQRRDRPEDVAFRYWYASDYKERPNKGGGKQGRHDENVNVAQLFVEDEQGQPVSGTVAKDIREMLRSLLHSLVWSGQAAASQDHLPHEARVYIHVSLARRFPYLLLCDGGGWKINLLIKQMYHGFSGNHIKAAVSHAKAEPADTDRRLLRPSSTPGPSGESQKRARQGSLGANLSNSKPSKMLRISPAPDDGRTLHLSSSSGLSLADKAPAAASHGNLLALS